MYRVLAAILVLFLAAPAVHAQPADPPRVIIFGAHPDDAELSAGGVATLWAREGASVKTVAMTNGDAGHFSQGGGPLAQRRAAEVSECADIFGATSEVYDIHDGELMPTLENRRKVVRSIREWNADIVIGHRRWDYHADHRYVGELVEDAAVLVVAPFFEPLTPGLDRNPIILHDSDNFEKPYPFQPDIVVSIDASAEAKWDCIRAMPSQMADADSWQGRYLPGVPDDQEGRAEFILNHIRQRTAAVADKHRDRLIELYGEEEGSSVVYAEAFEICQYGRQPSMEELRRLFPTFD
ncbi:MAG: PIG-L deacetylase family protein [Rhodothermales bacterium]